MRSGFEVPLADSYIADWAALCGFQQRFVRRYVAEYQLERRHGVRIMPEFACVFEVKVSRSDFLATFGRKKQPNLRASPHGSLHWVVAPLGMLQPEDIPGFWGLLVECGGGLREVHRPRFEPKTTSALHEIGYYLLWYGKDYPG